MRANESETWDSVGTPIVGHRDGRFGRGSGPFGACTGGVKVETIQHMVYVLLELLGPVRLQAQQACRRRENGKKDC